MSRFDLDNDKPFRSYRHVASRLGVPAAWLKQQAVAGRIPSIRCGKMLMLPFDEVKAVLTARSTSCDGKQKETHVDGQAQQA